MDCRIIAASKADLKALSGRQRFSRRSLLPSQRGVPRAAAAAGAQSRTFLCWRRIFLLQAASRYRCPRRHLGASARRADGGGGPAMCANCAMRSIACASAWWSLRRSTSPVPGWWRRSSSLRAPAHRSGAAKLRGQCQCRRRGARDSPQDAFYDKIIRHGLAAEGFSRQLEPAGLSGPSAHRCPGRCASSPWCSPCRSRRGRVGHPRPNQTHAWG